MTFCIISRLIWVNDYHENVASMSWRVLLWVKRTPTANWSEGKNYKKYQYQSLPSKKGFEPYLTQFLKWLTFISFIIIYILNLPLPLPFSLPLHFTLICHLYHSPPSPLIPSTPIFSFLSLQSPAFPHFISFSYSPSSHFPNNPPLLSITHFPLPDSTLLLPSSPLPSSI